MRHGGGKLALRKSSIQSLAAHWLRIAAVSKESRIVSCLDDGRREKANGKDRTERKHRKMGKNQKKEGRNNTMVVQGSLLQRPAA